MSEPGTTTTVLHRHDGPAALEVAQALSRTEQLGGTWSPTVAASIHRTVDVIYGPQPQRQLDVTPEVS